MTRGFVVTVVELDDAEARDLPDKENLLVRVFGVGQVASEESAFPKVAKLTLCLSVIAVSLDLGVPMP